MTDFSYKKDNKYIWPVAMRSRFNGVGGWHTLTDEQRAVHGWYPIDYTDSLYNPATEDRLFVSQELVGGVFKVVYVVRDLTLDELKAIKKGQLDKEFDTAAQRPIVDTGLGFEVHGGYTDLADFTVGADLGLTVIRAADNSMHTVTPEEFQTVLMAIKLRGFAIKGNKWELADAITAATNQEELDAIDINEGW